MSRAAKVQVQRRPNAVVKGLVVTGRFVGGRALDGRRRTNARWSHEGTELVEGHHAGRWSHYTHRRRSMVRLGGLAVALVLVYGASTDLVSTATAVRLAVWCSLAMGVWVLVHKSRKWSHHNAYVVPLAVALADRLDISRHRDPLSFLRVPVGHRTNPDRPVVVELPQAYRETERQQAGLARLVANKAGIRSHDWEIQMEGADPRLIVRAALVPPDEVLFREPDVKAAIEAVDQDHGDAALFLGYGLHKVPALVDWNLDSPHLALSFGSGAGKSTAVRSLAAQTVHKGGRAVLFDFGKAGESHEDWCRDENLEPLAGVEMYRDVASAHLALIAWDAERKRRSETSWFRTGESFQRALVVLEELNVSTPKLAAYWAAVRDRSDPAKSPAIQALTNLVCAGRSVKINCVAVAQRFDAACIGGGSVRASFQLRALSRFDDGARKMLIPEVRPVPKSSNHLGRMVLCVGGDYRDVQGTFMSPAEAVEWSRSGVEQLGTSPVPPEVLNRAYSGEAPPEVGGFPQASAHEAGRRNLTLLDGGEPDDEAPPWDLDGAELGDQAELDEDTAPEPELVTLAEFEALSGTKLKALRNARERDGQFPEPAERGPRGVNLYRLDHLELWERGRATTRAISG